MRELFIICRLRTEDHNLTNRTASQTRKLSLLLPIHSLTTVATRVTFDSRTILKGIIGGSAMKREPRLLTRLNDAICAYRKGQSRDPSWKEAPLSFHSIRRSASRAADSLISYIVAGPGHPRTPRCVIARFNHTTSARPSLAGYRSGHNTRLHSVG